MKVIIPGYTSLTGSPAAVLRLMEGAQIWGEASGKSYIDKIQEAAERCFGVKLEVTGETYEEQAESVLLELAKYNLVEIRN